MNTVTITGPGIDGNAIQVNPYFGDDGHKGEGVSAVSDPPGNWWHRDPPNQTGSDHLDVYWRKAGLSSVLWRPVDKAGQSWTNVATADDLARAEAIARGIAENGR